MSDQVEVEPMPRRSPRAYSVQMSVRVFEYLGSIAIFRRWHREGYLRAGRLAPHTSLRARDSP